MMSLDWQLLGWLNREYIAEETEDFVKQEVVFNHSAFWVQLQETWQLIMNHLSWLTR
jgi:hypothetical protein